MYLKGIKACCAQAFATVLVIRSKISEEQCLKRILDLVRAERFFLDLDVTTHVPQWDSNKKINDDHVSKRSLLWGAVRKNIISDRFSTKTAISAHI